MKHDREWCASFVNYCSIIKAEQCLADVEDATGAELSECLGTLEAIGARLRTLLDRAYHNRPSEPQAPQTHVVVQ